MRKFTIDDYIKLSERFNKLSFIDKIKTIQKNSDILTLCSDGNWWGVKTKDAEINTQLEEMEIQFEMVFEWQASEMFDLVTILGIDNTDI